MWKTFIDSVLDARLDISRKNRGFTVLSFAAEYGDLRIVEYLVQKGADRNVINCDGTTPLHIAAKHNHKDVVEFLVNLEGCVDGRDNNNRTPLHYVGEMFHRLVGVRPIFRGLNNTSASICSYSQTHMEISNSLLAKGANPNASYGKGNVPLLLAAKYSCLHAVKTLILWGADIKCCDKEKWTVLHYASLHGWFDVVQSIVERGPDVNAKNCSGDTPIILAIQNSYRNIFNLLVEAGADLKCCSGRRMTMLHFACQVGWMDIAQFLVERGFDVNAENSRGNTPLLLAAKYFHKDIYEMLFKSGAQLKCCNLKKWSMLHAACRAGWQDVVQSLVDAGFDINAKTRDHETPLFFAAKHSHMEIFDFLLEAGADVNIKTLIKSYYQRCIEGDSSDEDEAWTLLQHACDKGWLEVVQCLTKKGININEKSFDGDTPLHTALKSDNLLIVTHLLNKGADANIEGEDCETALSLLISNEQANAETIRLFIEHGSCVNYYDYKHLSEFSFFKENTLQDSELCTQAVINQFNIELEDLYEEPFIVENLPPVERMKMKSNGNAAHCIEQSVRHEIETYGYCNIVKVRPIVLSLLSLRALNYYI